MQYEDIFREVNFLEEKMRAVYAELEDLKKLVPKKAKLRAVRLKTAKKENAYHYFIRKDGYGQNGEYIRKKDREIAEVLAQIEYDEKLLVLLQDSLNQYKGVMKVNPFEAALDKMALGKRELVKMPFLSDERYLDEWRRQKYTGMLFRENVPEFYTRKGLRVRSKSELIIADILDEFSVPFLYEKPLQLRGGIVHPDFTLLNIRERREIYWEHFGIMDDTDYRNNAFQKLRNYEASGFYQHISLIWTFETEKFPLNTKEIRKMIMGLKNTLGYDSEICVKTSK